MKTSSAFVLWLVVLVATAKAQPEFDPVRMDEETDERFFFPTIEVTEANTLYCTWASGNVDWIGAYGREVDLDGNLASELDTVEIQSTSEVSCPPRVEFRSLGNGATCKMIYHE
ncbi:MAG: hypothetical protein KDB65_00760 [Calditrichaeota bacterium]|nr:hypothetical protein [Calditrichota bacterium]MCB9369253.1 hypothetical protein [Calditrichota bacterium]